MFVIYVVNLQTMTETKCVNVCHVVDEIPIGRLKKQHLNKSDIADTKDDQAYDDKSASIKKDAFYNQHQSQKYMTGGKKKTSKKTF